MVLGWEVTRDLCRKSNEKLKAVIGLFVANYTHTVTNSLRILVDDSVAL